MRIIGGTARSRVIKAPEGRDTRPTLDRVRESVFNILQRRIRDARTLDLYAGSGAMSLEALSRGAQSAVLVDCDRAAINAQKTNVTALRFENRARILPMEDKQAIRLLCGEKAQFDLVFLDPPYAMHDLSGVMAALVPLLAPDALIVLEHSSSVMPSTADGFVMTDSRRYGAATVSFFQMIDPAPKEE